MKRVLVTGANGFIGKALCSTLSKKYFVRAATRNISSGCIISSDEQITISDITPKTDWSDALKDVDYVVHLAARVHIMNDKVINPLEEFRQVNYYGTINLAKQAAKAGIKRFIYISSVKVNGEITMGKAFREDDHPVPIDPYGISKYEAEMGLHRLSEETNIEVVCIRPPLVYGAGVKANFYNMMIWLKKGFPLPFGSIHNKRSLVSVNNLVDFILTCLEHPSAKNQAFFVSDGNDLSSTELFERVSLAIGTTPRLLVVNEKILEFLFNLMGKKALASRLCGSLQVDISKAKELLNWKPAIDVDEGLRQTAKYFLCSIKKDSK